MSRAIIAGVVTVVVSALTAAAYLVATSALESRIHKDVEKRVAKAQELLIQNASLEGLGLRKRANEVARDEQFAAAAKAGAAGGSELANLAFRRFLAALDEGEPRPDFLAVANLEGDVVAVLDVSKPTPDAWKNDKGELVYPAVKLALTARLSTSELWSYEGKMLMRVGVAPIIDSDVDDVVGALVLAYSITAKEARRQQELHGMDVAYFHGETVHATSFVRGKGDENVQKQAQLKKPLFEGGLARAALDQGIAEHIVEVELDGERYLATAGRLPRAPSAPLPADYPAPAAGAVVLMSLSAALSPLGTVKLSILLVGAGSLVVALLAMFLTARRILGPLDEIELGINDIINGNLDRSFRPVGSDLDGLANALNVMLARMLDRPEPGEEEYDDDGNVVQAMPMAIDAEQLSPADAEAVALAHEPEPDYYKRVYGEYMAARRQVGEKVEGVTYEGFVAKLRLNEANLKAKHASRAVRFKVTVKDGKVSLKPVPIF